jgi:hypothetical protein
MVVVEIAPYGCGRLSGVDHHADHLGGHCARRHGDTLSVVTPVVAVVATIVAASVITTVVTAVITSITVIVAIVGPAVSVISSIRSTVTVVEALITILVVVVAALGILGVGGYSKDTLQLLALPHGMLGVAFVTCFPHRRDLLR